jgi:hypothetical protein
MRISHETIYRWVYLDASQDGDLHHHLRRRRPKRRRQKLQNQICDLRHDPCSPCSRHLLRTVRPSRPGGTIKTALHCLHQTKAKFNMKFR